MLSRDLWLQHTFLQSSMHSRGCSFSYFFVCCLGRFRKNIIGCSKMFLAVLAAWDKQNKNMHEHFSGRRKQARWCCYGYYGKNMLLWKYEMIQWAGISLNWITDWFCTYVCINAKHLYYAVYKQYTKKTRLLQNRYLWRLEKKSKFLKKLKIFMTFRFMFLILEISAVFESKIPKSNWHSRFYELSCWWNMFTVFFVTMSFLHLSCMWSSAGNGFH